MLYYLLSKAGIIQYLIKDQYTVGRKESDILITNDQSISRKHAIFKLQNNKVILVDCGAKYNTFIDNVKVEANVDIVLKPGSSIKFGVLESVYRLECISLITTTSGVTIDQKKDVIEKIKMLNGSYVNNWNENCTHLTVTEIMLTVKVLCALIEGKPIVTIKYWEDYVSRVNNNLPPPNIDDYKPSCEEIIINKNVLLDYKEERKTLFQNKVFVFSNEKEKRSMEQIIRLSGGDCRSWETHPISKEDLENSSVEYIIMQNTDSPTKIESDSLKEIIQHLKVLGKRQIPFTELALAIVNCSCEKDCNPNFNRAGTVLMPENEPNTSKKILALETQTQNLLADKDPKPDIVVPQSLDDTVCSQVFKPTFNSTIVQSSESISAETSKRAAEPIDTIDLTEPKKAKTTKENDLFDGLRTERKKRGKPSDLFDFFQKKKTKESPFPDIRESPSEAEQELASKKRKLEAVNSEETNCQKRKKEKNIENIQETVRQKLSYYANVSANLDVPSVTTNFSNNSWLSKKDNTAKEEIISKAGIDEEMIQFIESFRNTAIIVEKDLLRKQTTKNISTSVGNENKKNFKAFRKVKPLREQTTIIPRSQFIKIICNTNSVLEPAVNSEKESDDDEFIGRVSRPQIQKKRFIF